MTRNQWLAVCVACLFLAAGVRLWRLDFDLPEVADVDAGKFVDPAAYTVQTGDFIPQDFQYPRGYIHLLALLYKMGGAESGYARHFIARLLSALGGVGMVAAAGWLTQRIAGRLAVGVAMLLTAVSVECVTTSHVACTDTITACLMTLSLAAALAAPPRWTQWVVAGACLGFAAGFKFSGALVAPVILLTAVINGARARQPGIIFRDLAIVIAAAMSAFLITTPRFPVDAADYIARIRHEAAIQRYGQLGHIQLGWFDYLVSSTNTPEQPWLSTSLLGNLGPLVLLVALVAVAAAACGRAGQAGVLITIYIVGYLVYISGPGHLKAARFLLLILPALFALIGWLTEKLVTQARNLRVRALFSATMLVALLAWPLQRSLTYLRLLHQPSTNTLLREWLAAEVPQDAVLFISPFYLNDLWSMGREPLTLADAWEQQYRLPESLGPSAERTPIFLPQVVDVFAQNKVEYVLLNSYFEDELAETPENVRWFPLSVSAYRAFRDALATRADEVQRFAGYREGRSGPDITVYRMRK